MMRRTRYSLYRLFLFLLLDQNMMMF